MATRTLPDFEPAPSATRRDYVAQTLRTAILAGRIAPGTQLVETHFATQFGVSRGLLREAIRELIETGLVVNRPYAGTYVADIDEQTLSDVYEVRRIMEKQAFIRVWPQRDAAFRTEMKARYEALAEAVASRELSRESAAEAHFHGLVYERCGNHLLLDVWRQMTQKIQLGFAVCRLTHIPKPDYAENHELFMKLAIGDDLNAMLDELDAHLLRGLSTIRAALRRTAPRD
jgi:DNA-binding GntR family transcriptional regulator